MHPSFSHRRRAVFVAALAAACGAAPGVRAQGVSTLPSSSSPPATTLAPVTITGNPLGAADLVSPVTGLAGDALLLRAQGTLGETLSTLPGVSSTYFGPNASRPVIRGLDGDRVRILSNSGATLDASALSYDHAVAADPIAVERVEVLRGPAALLYGGNAIGGVVNLIDNRVPKAPMQGTSGRVNLGAATGNRERGGAALIESGNERFGLHADVFGRASDDVRVPTDIECAKGGGEPVVRRKICNSQGRSRGGAVGGSVFFDRGYLGASATGLRNDYGTVAEDDVTIRLRSNRYAVEGELRDLGGFVTGVKGSASRTDYRHTEFEGPDPGTVFKNAGSDFRLEARHAKLGPLEGVSGVQGERSRFSAAGEEAFAPFSRTKQSAAFVYEELGTGWGKLSFGGRAERVTVDSLGNPDVDRFTVGGRRFTPKSASVGALWNLAPGWQATGTFATSQRAPKDYELFANGPHVATGAYEVGNADLRTERSRNLDLGVAWKAGANGFKFNVFDSRFSNYIALLATGADRGAEAGGTDGLPEYAYTPVAARFRGFEASGDLRLLDAASKIDLELRADAVRADNRTTGEPLPRIAPFRVGATVAWTSGPWGARVGFDRAARQSRVPSDEQATGGYTVWQAALTYKLTSDASDTLVYARLDNATDRLAFSSTSILTQTAPGRSPLPGRSLKVGLQTRF